MAPRKGNDKGNIEGMVSYMRRNHIVPIPHFPDWKSFNADLEAQCSARQEHILRGHKETVGEILSVNLSAMSLLPAALFESCNQISDRVSSQSLVRYDTNDGSVPVACGHQEVWVRGYVDRVVIGCRGEVIARHPIFYCIPIAIILAIQGSHSRTKKGLLNSIRSP